MGNGLPTSSAASHRSIPVAAKFESCQDKAGESRFRLKAATGQVIATSEGYKSQAPVWHRGVHSRIVRKRERG